jgi:hypothetical protein
MFNSRDSWNEYLKTWSRLFHTFATAFLIALGGTLVTSSEKLTGLSAALAVVGFLFSCVTLYLGFWVLSHMSGNE